MDISGLVSYEQRSHQASAIGTPRGLNGNPFDFRMHSFPNSGLPNTAHFQSGQYAYSAQPVTSYQHLASTYSNSYPQQGDSYHFQPSSGTASSHSQLSATGSALLSGNPSPLIKHEHETTLQHYPKALDLRSFANYRPPSQATDPTFGTEVDTLMKAIQTKTDLSTGYIEQKQSPVLQTTSPRQPRFDENYDAGYLHQQFPGHFTASNTFPEVLSDRSGQRDNRQRIKTRYACDYPNCLRSFSQKTHLEIHTRAHTGVKPFSCKECHQTFSQLGNLKTHERRHTGERPYACEICNKRFSQRGNVRAHRIVHDGEKPFVCKLEECSKQFTQLGNLKSHQNKFHAEALRKLTQKFTRMRQGDAVTAADKELWEYFAALYKNSNKGIKGRGKDRRISTTHRAGSDVKADATCEESRSRSESSEHSSTHSQLGSQDPATMSEATRERESAAQMNYEQIQRRQRQQQYDDYGHRGRDFAFADRKPY